jgi:RND family efflux transporter MFP subunit
MNKRSIIAVCIALVIGLGIGATTVYFWRSEAEENEVHGREAHQGQREPKHGEEAHDGHGHGEHEKGVVHLNEDQLAGLALEPKEVKEGSLAGSIELPGEVQWNTDNLVHVAPRVSGVVIAVEKTLGDRVEVGDLLCVLDSREMGNAKMEHLADLSRFGVAKADFDRARVVFENTEKLLIILDVNPSPEEVLEKAHDLPVGENKNELLTSYTQMNVTRRSYERVEELLKSKIASEADFLEAKGAYEIARANYLSIREEISFNLKLNFLRAEKDFQLAHTEMRNSERALHILGLTNEETAELAKQGEQVDRDISRNELHSPISGTIVDRHLTHGELVNPETALYTIADLSSVWVMGRVYERDMRFLKKGQKAAVRLDAFPDEWFEGVVDYLGTQLDTATRTIEARVVLPNPQSRLRPGMFGGVTVFTEHGEEEHVGRHGLLVPAAALQRIKDGHVVFKMLSRNEYRQIPVRVIAGSKDFAEVAGELQVGDQVVIGDLFVLKSEVGKEDMGGGHSH